MYILKKKAEKAFLAFFAVILVFTSCSTGAARTEVGLERENLFASLEEGGSLYVYVDVQNARPILELIEMPGMKNVNRNQLNQILDRTLSAALAFYPEGCPRNFLVTSRGAYPSFRVNTAFRFDRAWRRQRSDTGSQYWRSAASNLSVALTNERAFVSDGDPFIPVSSSGTEIPEGFDLFVQRTVLSGWMPNAAFPINQYLSSINLPIEIPAGKLFFAVHPAGGKYEIKFRLETPSSSHARALTAIMGMARLFMPAMPQEGRGLLIGALFSNPASPDGVYVNMHTNLMSAEEVALLFTTLSVYSS